MKERIIKLINGNKLDIQLLYSQFIKEGGTDLGLSTFKELFNHYRLVTRLSIEDAYKGLINEYGIDLWYDPNGRLMFAR